MKRKDKFHLLIFHSIQRISYYAGLLICESGNDGPQEKMHVSTSENKANVYLKFCFSPYSIVMNIHVQNYVSKI